jgi:hypothetical protein
MATLETQYRNFLEANPDSTLSFDQWEKKKFSEIAQAVTRFKVGDKLIASDFDKAQYGLEYVTISSINEANGVYHWKADWNGGTMSSGYFFKDAQLYEDDTRRSIR